MARNRYLFAVSAKSDLPGGVRDVKDLWACLTDPKICGCERQLRGKDLSDFSSSYRRAFQNEFPIFLKAIPSDSEVVFYFSGHGKTDNKGGLLLCFEDGHVLFSDVIANLNESSASGGVIILDTCEAASASGHLKGPTAWTQSAPVLRRGFSLIASSDGPSQVDVDREQSYFTRFLLEGLRCGLRNNEKKPPAQEWFSIKEVIGWVNQRLSKENKSLPPASWHPEESGETRLFKNVHFDADQPVGLAQKHQSYVERLRDETRLLKLPLAAGSELFGLELPIREVFAKLVTTQIRAKDQVAAPMEALGREEKDEPLELRLSERLLFIIGDPGSGKSTFLRRLCQLAATAVCADSGWRASDDWLKPFPEGIVPVLIEADAIVKPLREAAAKKQPPLPAFFRALNDCCGLPDAEELFQEDPVLLLMDGLDEPADPTLVAKVLERLAGSGSYPQLRIVATVRPKALDSGEIDLPGFLKADVKPLAESAIQDFARDAMTALGQSERAEKFVARVTGSGDPELCELAKNPLMLACMTAMFASGKDLPDDRVKLFEAIITWLLKSRDDDEEFLSSHRRDLLEKLAFEFHCAHDEPLVRLPRLDAVVCLEKLARGKSLDVTRDDMWTFLDIQEKRSGVIVRRGSEMGFWHARLREYLAAHRLCYLEAGQRQEKFFSRRKLCVHERSQELLAMAAEHYVAELSPDLGGLFAPLLDLALAEDCPDDDQFKIVALLGTIRRRRGPEAKWRDPRYLGLLEIALDRLKNSSAEPALMAATADAIAFEDHGALWRQRAGFGFVTIPAGEFVAGGDPKAWDSAGASDEKVATFAIARFPVTVVEFAEYLEAHKGERTEPKDWNLQVIFPMRPVVGVNLAEAKDYAAWRGARLPSSIEWEFAARGPQSRIFPWGDEEPDKWRCNHFRSRVLGPSAVGLFEGDQTPEGVFDMGGNVSEWCDKALVCGGAFGYVADYCRAAVRNVWSDYPDDRLADLGFRLAQGTT